jgi:hypothetical protein
MSSSPTTACQQLRRALARANTHLPGSVPDSRQFTTPQDAVARHLFMLGPSLRAFANVVVGHSRGDSDFLLPVVSQRNAHVSVTDGYFRTWLAVNYLHTGRTQTTTERPLPTKWRDTSFGAELARLIDKLLEELEMPRSFFKVCRSGMNKKAR